MGAPAVASGSGRHWSVEVCRPVEVDTLWNLARWIAEQLVRFHRATVTVQKLFTCPLLA